MTPGTLLMLLASIALATTGQLLLKAGVDVVGAAGGGLGIGDLGALIGSIFTNWRLLTGLSLFGFSSIFWLLTLSRLDLSTAYPFVSLSYLLILGFSVVALGEHPPLVTWGGAALIMVGVILIGFGGFESS